MSFKNEENIKLTKKDKYTLLIMLSQSLLLIGVVCNYLVTDSNGSFMPFYSHNLSPGIVIEDNWVSFNDFQEVEYPYLSDIIPLGKTLCSIGDILMELGIACLIMFSFLWVRELVI